MKVKVISFATSGAYMQEAERLLDSCKKFQLNVNLVEFSKEFLATWNEAVVYKPTFIHDQLRIWSDYDGVLWTDADSEFASAPDWTFKDRPMFVHCDMAWHQFKRSTAHALENLTGTMFFATKPAVIAFEIGRAHV